MVPLSCAELIPGLLAVEIELTVTLEKSGEAASGSTILTTDTSSPFDCADGDQTTGDLTLTPLAQSHDEDSDGCADWEELGDGAPSGGLRDPFNFWDFFDTPDANNVRDKIISIADINRVVARFGATGDPEVDPLSAPPPAPAVPSRVRPW